VIEKKISLLLMPLLVFPAVCTLSAQERSRLYLQLGLITVASGILFLLIATLKLSLYNFSLAFHRDYFASIPYVYYSIYFSVGSFLLLNWLTENCAEGRRTLLIVLLLIYTTGMLVLIGSKTGIIAFTTALIYYFYIAVKSRRLFYFFIAASLTVSALFLAAYPATLQRFTDLNRNLRVLEQEKLARPGEFTGLSLRLYFWKISLTSLWQDGRFVTGVGTGDSQAYLDKVYAEHNLDVYGYTSFDAHNQWVMTLLQVGIAGIFILAALFVSGWLRARPPTPVEFRFFAWVIFCFSFSESLLESNKGIVFFALFLSVLCAGMTSSKNSQEAAGSLAP